MIQDQTRALVVRLRAHVNDRGGATLANGAWDMMLEAATEIERLTRELSEYINYAKRIRSYLSDAGYETIQSEQAWKARALAAESSLKAAVEAEREACAKVADTKAEKADSGSRDVHVAVQEAAWIDCANSIAAAIRSRAVGGNET